MGRTFQKKKIECRTLVFLIFMVGFFGVVGYMTYYSKVVFIKNLPVVDTVDPKRTGDMKNGRYTYLVPQDSLHIDNTHKTYLLTARYQSDILGQRYIAAKIDVWVLDKQKDGMAVIDGMVREEPVLTDTGDTIKNGDSIAVMNGG